MNYEVVQQNTKRVIAGLLAVWLSGAVFLFCCETSKAKTSETESCPLAKINHCHKKSADANDLDFVSITAENQIFDCCRFPARVFDRARKIETIQQAAEVATGVKIAVPKILLVKTDFNSPKIYQSFVRNRGGTFLQNRVFRI